MNFLVISNNRITILIREDKEDKERRNKEKGNIYTMEMRKRDNEKNVFIGANMERILNKKKLKLSISTLDKYI